MLQQKCFCPQTKFILNAAFRAAAGTPGEDGGIGLQDCCLPPTEMYIFQNKRQGVLADKKTNKQRNKAENIVDAFLFQMKLIVTSIK